MAKTSLDKSKIKFLLLEGIHQSAVDSLLNAGYTNIETLSTSLSEEELIDKIRDVHFIGIRSRTQLTERVFAAAEKLTAVGCFCIGTNQVDLDAALARAIPVFNAPFSNTRSVAELVLAETIMLLRGIPEKNARAHQGGWLKSAKNAHEARGKTLGIVGYGSIGAQLSVLAESLGLDVIYYDVVTKLALGNARQVGSLEELLARADVVSLHVPDLPATRWMIGAEQIALMKQGGILINASRGSNGGGTHAVVILAFQRHQRGADDDRGVVAREVVLVEEFTHFHLDQLEQLFVVDHVGLVQEHDDVRNADLTRQQDVLAGLRHRAVSSGTDQDSAVHLGSTGDHVLDVVSVSRAVDVRVVTHFGLVLDVSGRDGDTALALFRCVVDGVELTPFAAEDFSGNTGQSRRQSRLAVVDVTDGADVDVRFGAFKFFLSHCYNLFTLANG